MPKLQYLKVYHNIGAKKMYHKKNHTEAPLTEIGADNTRGSLFDS